MIFFHSISSIPSSVALWFHYEISKKWKVNKIFFQIYDEILILPLFPHFKKTHAQVQGLTFPAKSRLKFEKKLLALCIFHAWPWIQFLQTHYTVPLCGVQPASFHSPHQWLIHLRFFDQAFGDIFLKQ